MGLHKEVDCIGDRRLSMTRTGDTLKEAFRIHAGEVISLVGGGGKTTLMFALARELMTPGKMVITTTTTRIFPPSSTDSPRLFVSRDAEEIIDFIEKEGPQTGHVTVAHEIDSAPGKLCGIDPELLVRLSELESVVNIIVEADGAAHRSLKAPNRKYEPVIPANSSLVIPVVGIDVLGCEMREEFVFRSDIASRLTGLAMGDIISPSTIATLITHSEGIAWNSPGDARIMDLWGHILTGCCPKGFCNLNFKQTDRAIFWDNVIRRIMADKIPLSPERQLNTACIP